MDFDQVLEEIGGFGHYQRKNYFLICLPVMFAAANSLSYVFTAGTPAYRCLVPECEDAATAHLHQVWLVNATPGATNPTSGVFTPETCFRYRPNETYETGEPNTGWAATPIETRVCPREMFYTNVSQRCFHWVYDTVERTIVQEWELTCKENAWKLAFVGTMHFAGLVVGTALSGYLADRFGRKSIFIICIIFMAITGTAQGLAWDYESFLAFAFLNAVGTSGVYPLAFIIGVEMVGPRHREMSSIVLNYFYAVGEALVGVAAWWLHDWQLLQYALSVPPLLFGTYYWLVPESVRWLIARDERERAAHIIRHAAKVNKRELSMALLANFTQSTDGHTAESVDVCNGTTAAVTRRSNGKSESPADCSSSSTTKLSPERIVRKNDIWLVVLEVLKTKTLMLRYAVMMYIWIINSIVYYGLSLNATSLSGDKYLNFVLVCLVEIPGYTLAWFSLNYFGRRFSLTGSLLLCAVTCVAGGYITQEATWAVITLFLLGKLGITSSFAVVYTYTAEMMPTLIRSGGVGVMSTSARFGAMLAPFVPLLAEFYEPLPLLLFGGASLSAGLLALLLPETFRRKLPDTVAEAKQLICKKTSPGRRQSAESTTGAQAETALDHVVLSLPANTPAQISQLQSMTTL